MHPRQATDCHHAAPRSTLKRPAVLGCVAAVVMLAAVGGCGSPLEDRDERVGIDRLRRVQPLSLDDFRAKPPLTMATAGDASEGAILPAGETPKQGEGSALPVRPRALPGEPVTISIEQVRASAVSSNLDLKTEVIAPSISKERENAERAKFEAVFRPRLNYLSQNQPTFVRSQVNSQQQVTVGGAVDIPLRTGGRASVDLTADSITSGSSLVTSGSAWSTSAAFSIVQPLLRGGGEVATTASIRISIYNTEIAESNTRLAIISTLGQADKAYWTLYALRRELEVRQQQYELALTQLEQARRKVAAGTVPELEVMRAESGLASRLEAIVQAESNVLLQQRTLKRLANIEGLDVASPQQIMTQQPPEPVELELETDALQTAALRTRDELLTAELQILADSVGIDLAKNNALPGLDVSASYRPSGLGSQVGSSISDVAYSRFKTWQIGFEGNIPLGNEAAESRLREAILVRLRSLSTRASREQLVRKEVLDAVDRARSSWQRILAARQSTILAARTLDGERRQFDAGARTSTDVLDAAARVADAQSAEIRALTDYENAKVDLAIATGTILGSASVQWQPVAVPPLLDDRPRPGVDEAIFNR